jgi:2-methylisocitrate lyase-like PEP mutase family enzyme
MTDTLRVRRGESSESAALFRSLHQGPDPLVLANCWDAGSARLIESLGARALATTSAGLAWAQGFPDGDRLPIERLLATVEAIRRVTRLPLSVDVEGGYADEPAQVAQNVAALARAGAVGINLEDGNAAPELLVAKIREIKRTVAQLGFDVFVNARTDVYLRSLVPAEEQLREALARVRLYAGAGADGVFVPKVLVPGDIAAIVAAVELPLNVLAYPELPPLADLKALGVRRLSAGSGICAAMWGRVASLAKAFLANGEHAALVGESLPYPELNRLMTLLDPADNRS